MITIRDFDFSNSNSEAVEEEQLKDDAIQCLEEIFEGYERMVFL